MARRTKDEAQKTRNAILDAAEKVFYKNGVVRTSLEQIAAAAGVTRGAVYWHFRDKIEICEAMCDRVFLPQEDVLEQLTTKSSKTPLADLHKACADSLKLIQRDPQRKRVVTILMFRCEYVDDLARIIERRMQCKEHMLGQFRSLFERAQKLKLLAPGWTPHIAAMSLQAVMTGLIVHGLEGHKVYDLAKTGPACLKAFFNTVRSG
jgi:AcrR family transcriptional regulator